MPHAPPIGQGPRKTLISISPPSIWGIELTENIKITYRQTATGSRKRAFDLNKTDVKNFYF
jgi:hypothetical protein